MRGEDGSLILLRAGLHIQVSLKSFNEMNRGDHSRARGEHAGSVSKLADVATGSSGSVSTEDTELPEKQEEEVSEVEGGREEKEACLRWGGGGRLEA